MSFRVFNSVDMVVFLNDSTWDVEKFEKGAIWYSYNNVLAPIIYSIYQRSPERPLVLNQPYTEFKDKDGNGFIDDLELQDHLDTVLASSGSIEFSDGEGGSEMVSAITPLPVEDLESSAQLRTLIEMLEQQTITNKYLRKIYNPQ